MNDLVAANLLTHRKMLLAYIRKKISNVELAEDVLQDSLLKALRAAPNLQDEDKLLPWFFRILNNAITDIYRRKQVQSKYHETLNESHLQVEESGFEQQDEAALCACFRELIPTLKPEYAELIESLELTDGDAEQVAKELNINRNNLKVRRHRARQALRQRLEETCRLCAAHGCLDCHCQQGHSEDKTHGSFV